MVIILSMIALILCGSFYTQNFLRSKYIISNDLVNYNFVPSNNYQGIAPFFQTPKHKLSKLALEHKNP